METVYLSPSGIATYENCPRAYQLDRILKVRTKERSAALGFGGALSKAMDAFSRSTITTDRIDPVPVFVDSWRNFTANNVVKYSSKQTDEGLEETGVRLMQLFPEAWENEGLVVALDSSGEPMIERKLVVDIGSKVMLVTKLDLMAYNSDWELVLVDEKSTARITDVRFALMGEQLTAYQVAVTAFSHKLGLPPPKRLAYWELIKRPVPKTSRGEGPTIEPIHDVDARSDEDIEAYVEKVQAIADRVRNRDFPKTPRMAWNTPCLMCDFLDICSQKRVESFSFQSEEAKEAVIKLAA